MKTYLKQEKYKQNYNWLLDCNDLQRLPNDLSEIISEDEFTKIVFDTIWLTDNHNKQSLKRFAKWAFKQYYNEMWYLLCLKDRSERHNDI